MNTHRNEEDEKKSVATHVRDSTSGCSLFLLCFDVMVGLTYREELAKILGCDSISTPSKEHRELLQKSGRLSVFSPQANIIPCPLQCRPMSQSSPSAFNLEEVTFCSS